MALSRQQRVWLAILPKISSVFSLFGSTWIIIEVASERRKRKAPYHRLLLAMSVYDVLESVWNFGSTWPIPEGSPDIIWAFGNEATCTAQGFFLTLSSAVPLYNGMLSIYYVLVINYNYSDAKLRSFVEPAMHIFCFVWAFGTALYSALAGLMNNANLWCWIAPLPADCKDSWTFGTAEEGNDNPCIRGDNVWIYRFGFYFIPLWISIFLATFATYMVYRYVYARDKATLKYRFPDRASIFGALKSLSDDMQLKLNEFSTSMGFKSRSSTPDVDAAAVGDLGVDDNSESDGNSDDNDDSKDGKNHSSSKNATSEEFSSSVEQTDSEHVIIDLGVGGPLDAVQELSVEFDKSGRSYRSAERAKAFKAMSSEPIDDSIPQALKSSIQESTKGRDPTGAWALSLNEVEDASSSMEDSADLAAAEEAKEKRPKIKRRSTLRLKMDAWKSKRERFAREMPHTVEVFHQACYYLGAFYCTHIWSTSNRIVQTISGGGSVFPLSALHAFFDPFQGFLNYIVYQRPRYIQLRKRHPDLNRIAILLFILRFSFMGGNDARNLRSSTHDRDSLQSKRSKFSGDSKLSLDLNVVDDSSTQQGTPVVPNHKPPSAEPNLNAGL
eukprot:CAMPEP_0113610824 /NCGR_PEP_ID=MMETSP0017_2-20120614/5230_1 /TAXON_ID=2856 /ORGANISM="Cylindrotheca closterium" /LENGTH=610 /DNA_ID=CAMNT_0000519733 /DNA_START=1 /DNA_END=1833 /DNA_ORIENTATION=+ /assembly_acc=CAM_ASM_000147